MTRQHRHRVSMTREVAFSGPVRAPQIEAAHGGVCIVDACRCGAERRTNANGKHRERGEWIAPPAAVEVAADPDGGWAVRLLRADGSAHPLGSLVQRRTAADYARREAYRLGIPVREVRP